MNTPGPFTEFAALAAIKCYPSDLDLVSYTLYPSVPSLRPGARYATYHQRNVRFDDPEVRTGVGAMRKKYPTPVGCVKCPQKMLVWHSTHRQVMPTNIFRAI